MPAHAVVVAAALVLLGACREEPDFDQRYADAEKSIREKAAEMDSALAEAERARVEAGDAAAAPTPSPTAQ